MPIISKVGSRSLTVRLTYTIIFCVLILGAITMIYPFALMLTGATKSETDIFSLKPYPEYLFDDVILYRKYAESKYGSELWATRLYWSKPLTAWKSIQTPTESDLEYLDDFLAWRSQCEWWYLGHCAQHLQPINCRLFREYMFKLFDGDLAKFNERMSLSLQSWNELFPMTANVMLRYPLPKDEIALAFLEFAGTRPIRDRMIDNPDGWYYERYLSAIYTTNIHVYNKAHKTNYKSYDQMYLDRHVPETGLARRDWEDAVRNRIPLVWLRLSPKVRGSYKRFLSDKLDGSIKAYNREHGTRLSSFDELTMPLTFPSDGRTDQEDWENFLKDPRYCPAEAIEVYGPRQAFEEFVAERHGLPLEQVVPLRLPIAAADWRDCMEHKGELRWEFTTRNYKQVLGYLLFHGRGILNTIIYCSLAILLAVIVNPVAAYALSRYKPPSTYKVLLFCMATMAFPSEVTMIPAFLLLKRFPLWPLVGAAVTFGLCVWASARLLGKVSETIRLAVSLAIAVAVGLWLVPAVTGQAHVSLLNSFAALVLPGMANGYMIFLLKGFFDTLPRELYEAADIDGAGEWTKFWSFTMGLSKPILAVIALGAFTGAYTEFMMALIIIPDPKMWTIMVWLFQLQSQSHESVIYASLVIAAIPALLVFVLCQGVIMRGIVVPSEK